MKASVVLTRALRSLGPRGERWLKGVSKHRKTVNGKRVMCYCTTGAVHSAERRLARIPARHFGLSNWPADFLQRALDKRLGPNPDRHYRVHEWNDARTTRFADVRALFHDGIRLAKEFERAQRSR